MAWWTSSPWSGSWWAGSSWRGDGGGGGGDPAQRWHGGRRDPAQREGKGGGKGGGVDPAGPGKGEGDGVLPAPGPLTKAGRRVTKRAVKSWCSAEDSIKHFSGFHTAQGGWQRKRAPVVIGNSNY